MHEGRAWVVAKHPMRKPENPYVEDVIAAFVELGAPLRREGIAGVPFERLHIRNFKTFADATVDLGPATVLVGANDSGKSAIVDALAWLFSGLNTHRRRPKFETHAFESKQASNSHGLSHDGPQGPASVVVVGEFADLTVHERDIWAPLMVQGKVALRSETRPRQRRRGASCHDHHGRVRSARQNRAGRAQPERGGRGGCGGRHWLRRVRRQYLALPPDAFGPNSGRRAPLSPKPWPDPYVDFPTGSDLVSIRGPDSELRPQGTPPPADRSGGPSGSGQGIGGAGSEWRSAAVGT